MKVNMEKAFPRVCVVYNVYLHEQYKVMRMLESVSRLAKTELFVFNILLRGKYNEEAKATLLSQYPNWFDLGNQLDTNERFKDWKLNTLSMVKEFESSYYLLSQEDHLLIADTKKTFNYIHDCVSKAVDVASISFFQKLESLREYLKGQVYSQESEFGVISSVHEGWDEGYFKRNSLTPLLGLYKREFLLEALQSPWPLFKKYPPFSPFDFEHRKVTSSLLPFRFSLPRYEILACIDDGPPGTSLQDRNLFELDKHRIVNHNVAKSSREESFFIAWAIGRLNNPNPSGKPKRFKLQKRLQHLDFLLSRVRNSLIWWEYILRNRFFSLREHKLRI